MDTRFIFVLVFAITLFTTVLVAAVCLLMGQSLLSMTLYSVASMWITGITTQLLLQHLYRSVVKPLEEEREARKKIERKEMTSVNLDEVERIDDISLIPEDSLPEEAVEELVER